LARPTIIIIHPYDRTTTFLNKIVKSTIASFGDSIIQLVVEPNAQSHVECLEKLASFKNNELVLFFGHGRSDKLFGAKSDSFGKLFENEAIAEEEGYNYHNDNFINEANVSAFHNKKVICLSCNSNSDIAKYAIAGGANSFVGFGDIPTSEGEFQDHGVIVGDKTVAIMKAEINQIMKHSLAISIGSNYDLDGFKNVLALVTNKRISNLLIENKGVKTRRLISDFLYRFKSDIIIHGDKRINLIS